MSDFANYELTSIFGHHEPSLVCCVFHAAVHASPSWSSEPFGRHTEFLTKCLSLFGMNMLKIKSSVRLWYETRVNQRWTKSDQQCSVVEGAVETKVGRIRLSRWGWRVTVTSSSLPHERQVVTPDIKPVSSALLGQRTFLHWHFEMWSQRVAAAGGASVVKAWIHIKALFINIPL